MWLDQNRGEAVNSSCNEKSGREFYGMNKLYDAKVASGEILEFNSSFECGNLDKVVMVSPNEYDLTMRVDANTKGHH